MSLRFATCCAVAALAVGLSACAGTSEPARTAAADRPANATTAEALARIADRSRAAGDPVSAVAMLKSAHQMDPNSSAILADLGRDLAALSAWPEAAEAYRKAVKLAPDDPAIRRGYAGALLALNQPTLAEPEYRAALAAHEDAATLCGLGVSLDLQGRHEEAEAAFRKAYQLDPNSAATRANLALSLALWNTSDEAIRLLAPMAASPDATPKQRQNLALVFGLAGELDQAAAIARIDLGEDAVRSNLSYYETLRALPPVERMRAIMGAKAQPPLPPRKPEFAAVEDKSPADADQAPMAPPTAAPGPKRAPANPARTAQRVAPQVSAVVRPTEASRIAVPAAVEAAAGSAKAESAAISAADDELRQAATPAEEPITATAAPTSDTAPAETTPAGATAEAVPVPALDETSASEETNADDMAVAMPAAPETETVAETPTDLASEPPAPETNAPEVPDREAVSASVAETPAVGEPAMIAAVPAEDGPEGAPSVAEPAMAEVPVAEESKEGEPQASVASVAPDLAQDESIGESAETSPALVAVSPATPEREPAAPPVSQDAAHGDSVGGSAALNDEEAPSDADAPIKHALAELPTPLLPQAGDVDAGPGASAVEAAAHPSESAPDAATKPPMW